MPSKEKMAAAEHYSPTKVSRGGKSLQMQRIIKAIPSVKKKKRKFSNIRETICSTQKQGKPPHTLRICGMQFQNFDDDVIVVIFHSP